MGDFASLAVVYANGILHVIVKYLAFTSIFRPNVKKCWIVLSYAGFILITTQIFFGFANPVATMSVNVLIYLALSFLFSGNISTKLIFAAFMYAASVLSEVAAYLILNHIHYVQYGVGVLPEYVLLIGRTISSLVHLPLIFTVAFAFKKFLNRNARSQHFMVPLKYTVSILLMLLGIIIVNVVYINAIIAEMLGNLGQVAIAQLASSGVIVLIVWVYNTILNHMEEFEKNRHKDQMLERWKLQYQTIADSQKVIERLKHNLKFHFLTISGFLENNATEKAKEHIKSEIGSFDTAISTGNISIDSLFNYYRQRAEDNLGINLETELFIPPNMQLESSIVVTILGNALENAIEACEHVDTNKRYINCKAVYTPQNQLIITITNPYEVAPVVDSYGRLITTKTYGNHGLGLASAFDLMPDDLGHIHTEFGDNTFKFILHLYTVLI